MTIYDDPMTNLPDPSTIYQDWLDEASLHLMEGRIDAFVLMVGLPFMMRTVGAETLLETADEVALDAANLTEAFRSQNVTNYIRLVQNAHYLQPDVIEGWHSSHVLRNALNVVPSYSNRMVMRNVDGKWKVTEAEHELTSNRLPIALLKSDPGAFTERWAEPKADIRATQARAEPIYQIFIEALSDAVVARDADRWLTHFTYPHTVHYATADHVVETETDERAFFDGLVAHMEVTGADRVVRHVRFAEFISGDRIVGYHGTFAERDGEVIFGPIQSRMVLVVVDNQWRCTSVTNSLSNNSFPASDYKVTESLPTMREIQERMRK